MRLWVDSGKLVYLQVPKANTHSCVRHSLSRVHAAGRAASHARRPCWGLSAAAADPSWALASLSRPYQNRSAPLVLVCLLRVMAQRTVPWGGGRGCHAAGSRVSSTRQLHTLCGFKGLQQMFGRCLHMDGTDALMDTLTRALPRGLRAALKTAALVS